MMKRRMRRLMIREHNCCNSRYPFNQFERESSIVSSLSCVCVVRAVESVSTFSYSNFVKY